MTFSLLTYLFDSLAAAVSQNVKVWQWPMDLGDLDQVGPRLQEVFSKVRRGREGERSPEGRSSSVRARCLGGAHQIEPAVYERAFLFNNAGAVWPLTFTQVSGLVAGTPEHAGHQLFHGGLRAALREDAHPGGLVGCRSWARTWWRCVVRWT